MYLPLIKKLFVEEGRFTPLKKRLFQFQYFAVDTRYLVSYGGTIT